VKKSMLLALPLILALLAAPAIPQGTRNNYPTPPPPLNSTTGEKEPATFGRRVDLAKLQREADELSRVSQTIPSDLMLRLIRHVRINECEWSLELDPQSKLELAWRS